MLLSHYLTATTSSLRTRLVHFPTREHMTQAEFARFCAILTNL